MGIKTQNYYTEIINQVILLEKCRYDMSQAILRIKKRSERRRVMITFLCLDLEKHQLFEHAAQLAIQANDQRVIERLQKFYCHGYDSDNILDTIDHEISNTRKFINVMQRSLYSWADMTFMEKRLNQEIERYILARARYHQK